MRCEMRDLTLFAIFLVSLFTWNTFAQLDPSAVPVNQDQGAVVEEIQTIVVRQNIETLQVDVLKVTESLEEATLDDLDISEKAFTPAIFVKSPEGHQLVEISEGEDSAVFFDQRPQIKLNEILSIDSTDLGKQKPTQSFYFVWWWRTSYYVNWRPYYYYATNRYYYYYCRW